ncbi:MAG TPA: hypothetical protein VL261_06280 [Nitrospira sp.]|jgi:hypothetical protein|nr:hypothetical protein [Nitrospira sp.]
MRDSSRPTGDEKDLVIGGCPVRLTYGRAAGSGWTVHATIRCGVGDHADEQSLVTQAFESRDAAEQDALQQVAALLGNNTDRSRSRVRNWS